MPSASQIAEQTARESERRARLGVPAFAGGFLYFLSAIIVTSTLSSGPTVGLLQGLAPALRGVAHPAVSPRAAELRYVSHHAFPLIAGSVVKSIALLALTLVLLLLCDAAVFRRPESWRAARPLVLIGGLGLALVNVAHQIVGAANAHSFVTGHDLSNHAVEQALYKGPANLITQYLNLATTLLLIAGMIAICLNAIRVGLLTRWLGIIGMFSAVLILLPIGGATLEIIPAFWMLAMGVLYLGRWPNGDPPAWAAGEARPWPSQAELRAQRQAAAGGDGSGKNGRAGSGGGDGDLAPEPTPSPATSARKRARKRR